MNKSDIRKIHHAKRRAMTSNDVMLKSSTIQNKIFDSDWYKNLNTIMIYISFQNEVETHKIIQNALELGKRVIVPVCVGENDLIPVEINNHTKMKANKYGILEPENVVKYEGEIHLVIVPGVAFDRSFNRVGFGRGYYDRFLCKYPYSLKVGVCFQNQLCEKIDADGNDIPMNIIITEEEIIVNND